MITPKEIIRTRRRSIALVINKQGELIVRAPYYASKKDIMGFVEKKQSWIEKQQLLVAQEKESIIPVSLEENACCPIEGKNYYIAKRGVERITLYGDALLVPLDCTIEQLKLWLQQRVSTILSARVSYYAQYMQVIPKSVKLSPAKTKWGSCSYLNALRFSWRLIFCPPQVLDYIVVHELSHIKVKSHDIKFWTQVASVLPNYKEQEKWLKTHRKVMEIL